MAVSAVLAPAVTQTSSLGIFTLFNLSTERIPKQIGHPPSPPPPLPQQQQQQQQQQQPPLPPTSSSSSSQPPSLTHTDSSLSSSPRHFPTDLSHPILEEGDESESDTPNEPVTPVSGRQSQDFHTLQSHDIHHHHHHHHHQDANSPAIGPDAAAAVRPDAVEAAKPSRPPVTINTTAPTPPPQQHQASDLSRPLTSPGSTSPEPQPSPLSRRSTRGSTTGFRRTMSSFFRRSNSQSDKAAFGIAEPAYTAASDSNLADAAAGPRKVPSRRYSMHKSSTTTQSNTPPSPGSPPLEMASLHKGASAAAGGSAAGMAGMAGAAATATVPSHEDFLQNKKKNRASTGLSLHRAINFVTSSNPRDGKKALLSSSTAAARPARRRASSFDFSKKVEPINKGEPWALPAEAGTGLKARRMSLSLPDDFTVDIAELHDEFEYQHKLGRHRKHLGKGATSKVTLMYKKDFPDELYAVKEFRGKSSSETKEEYEKKVKSEYSIAKSLHHPNVVETIRLCTDRGRWTHVMEYCQEGDLYSLVEKKYLQREDREKDRLCLFKQLVQGINYLHSHGIAHRDIKLENLLITNNSKLKITDFGVSEVFSGIHPGLREAGGQCGINLDDEVRLCAPGICGSLPYISPEVIAAKEPYDPRKLDVWGAAIVMVCLIFGAPMWKVAKAAQGSSDCVNYLALVKGWDKWNASHQAADDISDGDYPKVPAFDFVVNPPVLRRILLQMLNPNPAKRITIEKVAAMRWMKGVECCQLDTYDDPAKYIDASKKSCTKINGQKIFCHDHLPPRSHGSHSLGKMPGSVGY